MHRLRIDPRRAAALALGALAAGFLAACGSSSSANTLDSRGRQAIAQAEANPVAVSPQPGTPDASPSTQISFLGGPGTTVSSVSVRGSRSGAHSGVLRAYSTGTGESFLPRHPFSPGERVTVAARMGDGSSATTTFTIAHEATVATKPFPNNPGDPRAIQRYVTAPSFAPSSVRITTAAKPGAAPGYLFLAPYQGRGTPGVMIAEQNGALVWFHPLPAGWSATNFQVQSYQGKPALTWWQGRILQVGFGQGEDVIYDGSYRQVARVRAGNGLHADLHEVRLTPQGTAWIDMYEPIHMNLSSAHGASDGVLSDAVAQEVDVKTGLVMWEWHFLGNVPPSESNNPAPRSSYPWDFAHINSVDPGGSGDVLLSARNTWALYDVDMRSGAIRWRLGGRRSDFKQLPGTRFYWQHDAEFQPGGLISVFDNGSSPPKERQSRGLLLAPDASSHTVSLRRQFVNPSKALLADSQANMLGLPGGSWLLGYGALPNFTEFDASGHVLLDGTLGRNVQNFRTYLSPWSGHAPGSPTVVAKPKGAGALAVSVSWNGATDVTSWRVLAGPSPNALSPVAGAPRSGFQTTIAAPTSGPYVQAQALDAAGEVIGSSAAVRG